MYRSYDLVNGEGPLIYRTPVEIGEDIRYIKFKIGSINDAINLREMLTSILSGNEASDPETLVEALADVVSEAKDAISELRELEEELSALEAELEEVKCIMRW